MHMRLCKLHLVPIVVFHPTSLLVHCYRHWKHKRHKLVPCVGRRDAEMDGFVEFCCCHQPQLSQKGKNLWVLSRDVKSWATPNCGCKAASTGDSDNSSTSPSLVPALLLGGRNGKRPVLRKEKQIMNQQQPSWVFFSWFLWFVECFLVLFSCFVSCYFLSWKDKIFSSFSSLLVLCYSCVLPVESLTVTGLKLLSLLLQHSLQVKTFSSNSAKQDLVH